MAFPGYPLSAAWSDNDANLTQQAAAHNRVEVAVNSLQAQVDALASALAATVMQVDESTNFQNLFDQWLPYTPTLTNATVGSSPGARYGKYVKLGALVLVQAGFTLGSGFTMSAVDPVGVSIPFPVDLGQSPRPVFATWLDHAGFRYTGTGVVLTTSLSTVTRFVTSNTALGWRQGVPATLASGDTLEFSGFYWTPNV